MGSKRALRVPKLTRHRGSGQGVARFNGQDKYFGVFGAEETQRSYEKFVGEWLAAGKVLPEVTDEASLTGLCILFMRRSERYYRDAAGKPTSEVERIRVILKRLRAHCGEITAAAFGPRSRSVPPYGRVASSLGATSYDSLG